MSLEINFERNTIQAPSWSLILSQLAPIASIDATTNVRIEFYSWNVVRANVKLAVALALGVLQNRM